MACYRQLGCGRLTYDEAMNSLAGCVALLLVSSVLGCAQDEADIRTGTLPAGITCGVGDHGQTTPLRNSAGFTVVLKMQSDDDHGKNSHQCAAEYSLEIARPDGTSSSFKVFYSDDEWNRPLAFRVEGFSPDGKNVFVFISEGSYPADIIVGEYNISSSPSPGGWLHEVKSVTLDAPFARRVSRECAATLHIMGTTPEGDIVLGTEARNGCVRVERWRLSHNKHVMRDGLPAEVPNNHPAHLQLHTAVTKLEAGTPVETQ